jgi:cytochrome c heme-lyase
MGNTPSSLFGQNIAEAHKGYESKYKGWERFCPVPHVRNGGEADGGDNDKPSEASANIASAESNDSSLHSKCPVMRKEEKVSSVAAESKCPVKRAGKAKQQYNVYSQPIDPTNQMPANPNQLPRPNQTKPIDTARVKSSIPKGGTDSDTWTYPSPQMFYNALNRKGKGDGVAEDDVATVVAIHNNMNERTWDQVLKWEKTFHCRECPQGPKLLKFLGRPDELSPKAQIRRLTSGQEPFDRHDWTIDRCGKEVRYVIDYYHDEDNKEEENVPHLRSSTDIKSITMVTRPALDSIGSIFDRIRMPVYEALSWDFHVEKDDDHEVEKVETNMDSQIVFDTIQSVKVQCEKSARLLSECNSQEECERAEMAFSLCYGKVVCPTIAAEFGNNPCEDTYSDLMDCLGKFQEKATTNHRP